MYRTAVRVGPTEAPALVGKLINCGGPAVVLGLLKSRMDFESLRTDVHEHPPFGLNDSRWSCKENGIHYILSWDNAKVPAYMFLTLKYGVPN